MERSRRQFLFAAACTSALTAGEPDVPPLSAEAVALIEAAFHMRSQFGPQVWPGWADSPVPFIYVDSEFEYGLYLPKELQGAVPAGIHPRLRAPVQVRRRVCAADSSAAMDVEGVTMAVVMGTPAATGKTPARWQLTAQHEMFHVFQAANNSTGKIRTLKLGPENDASWQLNFPFPYTDPEVMRLVHLQGYLAYLGVMATDRNDCRYNAGAALEAAQVYRAYLKKIDPDGRFHRYSEFQEWSEGVAFCVEYQIAKLAAPTEDVYRRAWESDYAGRLFLVKHAGRAAKSRTAFYHLGMAKTLLLDRLKPAWKQDYFRPDVWLDDLLEAALRAA
jgi:hypothetical protein